MNKTRLLTLAKHLRTVPPDKFDLAYWKCGAAGCAIGHACDIPSLKYDGLRMEHSGYPFQGEPVFGEQRGWDAVASFFGISRDNAFFLFDEDSYIDDDLESTRPEVVADRIEAFVKNY